MAFQVGDKVIYPNHGLGIVERVEEKTILGQTLGFFHLRIVSNDTTVLVPVANVDNVGLRKAITDEEVERLFPGIARRGVACIPQCGRLHHLLSVHRGPRFH